MSVKKMKVITIDALDRKMLEYINHDLAKHNQWLLMLAKKIKKENNHKNAWCTEENIFLTKD